MNKRRIALRPEVSTDDVDGAAFSLGWPLAGVHEAEGGQPREDVYNAGDETTVHLLHDDNVALRYLVVRGENVDEVVEAIKTELDTVSPADAVKEYETGDKTTGLALLGVASDDGEVRPPFADALRDPDKNIRRAAILTLGYVGGRDAEALLEPVAANDEDEVIREDARVMLEGLRLYG